MYVNAIRNHLYFILAFILTPMTISGAGSAKITFMSNDTAKANLMSPSLRRNSRQLEATGGVLKTQERPCRQITDRASFPSDS